MDALEPGELASLGVTFIEDRDGRAIVRLPNGSKTTVDHGALRPIGGFVHFVQASDGPGETAWCQAVDCGWSAEAPTRVEAEDAYLAHLDAQHPDRRRA